MEHDQLEQHVQERQLQIWEKLMYAALGSAVTILFHVTNPLRDAILILALAYTTSAGLFLLWSGSWRNMPFTELRSRVTFGHLLASWLVAFGIFSYSRLPPLGLVLFIYTVFLLWTYRRTRKRLSRSEEMFP
jgi:predicted neutral ceramidase superfamily lipid hydrolase